LVYYNGGGQSKPNPRFPMSTANIPLEQQILVGRISETVLNELKAFPQHSDRAAVAFAVAATVFRTATHLEG
jgi:hypothetical protein